MIANEVPSVQSLCAAQKIILYYGFTPLDDPDAIRLWQRTLCDMLSLKGRILISRHGINGTLGGTIEDLKRYIAATKDFSGFRGIDFKWSEGSADDFPRLRIRVRDEIVSFGAADELSVDRRGVVGGGVHLKPDDVTSWSSNEATTSSSLTRETPSKPQSAVSRTPSFPTCSRRATSRRCSTADDTTISSTKPSSRTVRAACVARSSLR